MLEYFISSRGARKGMADTALRTADSGYLTRRLVDVSQEVIIREDDCGTDDGIEVSEIEEHGQVIETFAERVHGRYPHRRHQGPPDRRGPVHQGHHAPQGRRGDPGEARHPRGEDPLRAHLPGPQRRVRPSATASTWPSASPWAPARAVGIIAAQSIGEPGTQLTMRTFHTGGVAGGRHHPGSAPSGGAV